MSLRYLWLSWFAILVLALAGCSDDAGDRGKTGADPAVSIAIQPNEPIKLGVIQTLSGPVAPLGEEQMRGLTLALERRGGKLLGHKVELIVEDTGCLPEGGANAALKLVTDPQVAAVFGTTCSGDAASASEIVSQAGLTMISGNNSAAFLTRMNGSRAPKWQPGYFRTAPNEESSGPAAATFAYERLGIRRAATVNDGDLYTTCLTDGFARKFKELGGQIVLAARVNKSDGDMGPVLTAVANAQAQLVFFPLFQPEGNALLLRARKSPALRGVTLMSDGSLIEQSFIDAVGRAAVGMYFVGPTPPAPSPELSALRARYARRFKTAPASSYYVNAYDAAQVLFSAIEKAAVKKPSGALRIDRAAVRQALRATDTRGVEGKLRCDEFGDCAPPRFNVLRLSDPTTGVAGLTGNVQYTYEGEP